MAAKPLATHQMASDKGTGVYDVARYEDGFTCSCKSFEYRQAPCKHIKRIANAHGIPDPKAHLESQPEGGTDGTQANAKAAPDAS